MDLVNSKDVFECSKSNSGSLKKSPAIMQSYVHNLYREAEATLYCFDPLFAQSGKKRTNAN